jgi:hypothetical protein
VRDIFALGRHSGRIGSRLPFDVILPDLLPDKARSVSHQRVLASRLGTTDVRKMPEPLKHLERGRTMLGAA